MYRLPSSKDITDIARQLGFEVGDDEVDDYRALLVEQLQALDEFVQSRTEEDRPPLLIPDRAPGHRPSTDEDPHNAWLWKCSIGESDEGLLAGRTVSFKDHIAVAGIPLTFGAFALDHLIPDFDATVATRVLAQGGTITGKNTLFGLTGNRGLAYGQLGDYGDPVNPLDAKRLTGGSSSGSSVAVALGDVDIAFGGDQAGSLRIPAAWCGVVGLKPSFGLVSHMGVSHAADPSIDHVGPIAKRAIDAATALQAVAGYDAYDPRQGREVPERIDVLTGIDAGVKGLRIGVLQEGFAEPIDPVVRDSVLAALDKLAAAGAVLTKVSVPEHESVQAAAGALMAEGYLRMRATSIYGTGARTFYPTSVITAMDRLWMLEADLLKTYYKANFIGAELSRRNFHGAVYAKAQNVRPTFIRAYDKALAEVDVLAMPTCLTVAPEAPADPGPTEGLRRQIEVLRGGFDAMIRNTVPFSYTGHPAIAVPCPTDAGLPASLQVVAPMFADGLALRVAHTYQS